MRFLYLAPLLLLVLVMPGAVYGEISIQVDKTNYKQGDVIHVTGSISEDYQFNPRHTISFGVYEMGNDNSFYSEPLKILEDRTFSTDISTSFLKGTGDYFVRALYGVDDSIAIVSFSFEKPQLEIPEEDLHSINPIKDLEERVTALEQRNAELEAENKSLLEQITQLQEELQSLNTQFVETIQNQLDWFVTQIQNQN